MFSVPSPGSPPRLHNGPVQEHMENSPKFSVALFHLQDFPNEISGRAAAHSSQERNLGLAKSQVFLIHSLWSVSGNQLIFKLANKGIKVKNRVFILPFLYKSKTSEKPKSGLGKFFFFEVFQLINEERIIGKIKELEPG